MKKMNKDKIMQMMGDSESSPMPVKKKRPSMGESNEGMPRMKKGGKIRGCGMARGGAVRKCKMVKMKGA